MDWEENCQKYVKGKVSAVTPAFNAERYLPAMLDSVLDQTYPDIEMILVDDGSADGTVSAAESYCGKFAARGYGYRIVRTGHKNASAAINAGLPYVTGEYLIWPDSDDVLDARSVENRVRFLQSHPEYRCVRSLPRYFDSETGEDTKADEKEGNLSKEDLFWDILEIKTFVCCGCYMLKTKSFFEIYPERHIPEYDVGQNFQMLLPFMFRHKCPTLQEPLYMVRVRPESHSRRLLTRREEEKKYRDYELLVDEIAGICGIRDMASKRRIEIWKTRRRRALAVKYEGKNPVIRALDGLVRLKKKIAAAAGRGGKRAGVWKH